MKKNILVLVLVIVNLIGLMILSGCSKAKEDKPFDKFSTNPPKDALALIINSPTKEQLDSLKVKEEIEIDKSGEELLLIPKNQNTSVQIWSITYKDGHLTQDKMIYSDKTTKDDFVLKIKINRPEGIPAYKMIINNGKNSNEYLFDYNGKTGTPHIEYI